MYTYFYIVIILSTHKYKVIHITIVVDSINCQYCLNTIGVMHSQRVYNTLEHEQNK